jgi:uncharacterized protein YciW
MNSPQVAELVGRYRKALEKLNGHSDKLSESQKNRYLKLKSRFEAQMTAWENISVTEPKQITANLEESYNEIESIWYSTQGK